MKIRVPGTSFYQDYFKALGADVQIMNLTRVYDALKAGTRRCAGRSVGRRRAVQVLRVQKYAASPITPGRGYNMLASLKVWQSLPADIQRVIETNARNIVALQRADTDNLNEQLRRDLEHHGMMFNNADLPSFHAVLAVLLSALARTCRTARVDAARAIHGPARIVRRSAMNRIGAFGSLLGAFLLSTAVRRAGRGKAIPSSARRVRLAAQRRGLGTTAAGPGHGPDHERSAYPYRSNAQGERRAAKAPPSASSTPRIRF
jgi:hypothetical protein